MRGFVMKPLFVALLVFGAFGGCMADDSSDPPVSLFDPTGSWALTLHWGAGTCDATGIAVETVNVLKDGTKYVATTTVAHETAAGTIETTDNSASMELTITNTDAKNDGGSTRAVLTVNATVGEALAISGTGSITVTGATSCSQPYTISGTLSQ